MGLGVDGTNQVKGNVYFLGPATLSKLFLFPTKKGVYPKKKKKACIGSQFLFPLRLVPFSEEEEKCTCKLIRKQ